MEFGDEGLTTCRWSWGGFARRRGGRRRGGTCLDETETDEDGVGRKGARERLKIHEQEAAEDSVNFSFT
jgi:hypothetical protein